MQLLTEGSPTSPLGFLAGSAACGLKSSGKPDLALLFSPTACAAAGVFTRNRVAAAPVVLDRQILATGPGRIRAVVANAGVANACTGEAGLQAAREMQRLAAEALNCGIEAVLVLSTGVIGVLPDLEKVASGISMASASLTRDGGAAAAQAIMTTDTRPKHLGLRFHTPAGEIVVGGMAKGSGMIHPDMATMLAVITTDAQASPGFLQTSLTTAVERSFNRISVDGDTSTNDTVLLLANGSSGVDAESRGTRQAFGEALTHMCAELARAIVRDGEGASKFISLHVTGAASEGEAAKVARTIATSPLVKTAFAGGDPNWGRILAAAGRAGVPLDPGRLSLWIAEDEVQEPVQLAAAGSALEYDASTAEAVFSGEAFVVRLDLGQGEAEATVWTCDLTTDYVRINADYHT